MPQRDDLRRLNLTLWVAAQLRRERSRLGHRNRDNASFMIIRIHLHLNVFDNSFQDASCDLNLTMFGVNLKIIRINNVESFSLETLRLGNSKMLLRV